MGPSPGLCQAPTVMRPLLFHPVGNSRECQPKRRSGVSGCSQWAVASIIRSTMPPTSRRMGTIPPMSIPRREATDDRTSSGFRISPSISLVLTTPSVTAFNSASCLRSNPRDSMRPSKIPCWCLTLARSSMSSSWRQVRFGQSGCSCMYNIRNICGYYTRYSPHRPLISAYMRRSGLLFSANDV